MAALHIGGRRAISAALPFGRTRFYRYAFAICVIFSAAVVGSSFAAKEVDTAAWIK